MKDTAELNRKQKIIEKEHLKFYNRLKKRPPAGLDREVEVLDAQVFASINCMSCANCCKTISPVFKHRDIERLASLFKMTQGAFTEKYLCLDEDGDYVLKSTPCPFLAEDNSCRVYENRPAACRSYPHTATIPATRSWNLIVKNSAVCPAVYEITAALRKKYDQGW